MRVLVVEDDRALSALLKQHLESEGHEVRVANDGDTGAKEVADNNFDLLVLDLNLPGRDGTELLKQVRQQAASTIVLVLSARSSLEDRMKCFELGADDCLTKPFALRELTARTRALLRRRQSAAEAVLRCADLELNRVERSVLRNGRNIDLTAREYALVEYLLQNKGQCVPRSKLLNRVWNMPEQSETNVVDVYVNYLRRKLDQGFSRPLIHTVRGEGYLMQDPKLHAAADKRNSVADSVRAGAVA